MSINATAKSPGVLADIQSPTPSSMLLVEDSPGEAELFCHAVAFALESQSASAAPAQVHVRHTATDALAVLKDWAARGSDHLPDLVVLDLDLPGGTSVWFLQELRQDALLKNLPVVVMAWSEEESIVRSLYTLGVAAYVIKPLLLADLFTLVSRLCQEHLPARESAPGIQDWGRGR